MAKSCVLTVKDEVWCFFSGLAPADIEFLWNKFAIYKDGYFFMPAYKLGRWDGKIRFFEKTGKTYFRLIDQILPYLDQWGYDIQLVDQRKPVVNPVMPKGVITKLDALGIATEGAQLDLLAMLKFAQARSSSFAPISFSAFKMR
jgi:hypothetical protein